MCWAKDWRSRSQKPLCCAERLNFVQGRARIRVATVSSSANSPLKDAVVNGNDNTLSSNLKSRVIQMVIMKNVTLAQAWGILDLARTNKTNNITAFPFFATVEFYTLGLAWEVSKLVANTSGRQP